MNPIEWADLGGKIVMGNLVGFFIMVLVVWRLWKMMEATHAESKANLASCIAREAKCQEQIFTMAQAAIDQAGGRPHEARARAQTVIDHIAIASSTPIVTGPGPSIVASAVAAQPNPPPNV